MDQYQHMSVMFHVLLIRSFLAYQTGFPKSPRDSPDLVSKLMAERAIVEHAQQPAQQAGVPLEDGWRSVRASPSDWWPFTTRSLMSG